MIISHLFCPHLSTFLAKFFLVENNNISNCVTTTLVWVDVKKTIPYLLTNSKSRECILIYKLNIDMLINKVLVLSIVIGSNFEFWPSVVLYYGTRLCYKPNVVLSDRKRIFYKPSLVNSDDTRLLQTKCGVWWRYTPVSNQV